MKEDKLVMTNACKNKFEPVIGLVDTVLKGNDAPIIIGIDGMCASGKTTLGYYLKSIFHCNLFHMDDFFLQEHQRTPERLGEVGGNVDYERFREEVVDSILKLGNVRYRPYDCSLGTIQAGEIFPFKRLNIIEGSYCQNPYLGDIYQLKIFMSISDQDQMNRIKKRNGDILFNRFKMEWIPKENLYFERFQIRENSLQVEV